MTDFDVNRRGFLGGLAAMGAAPEAVSKAITGAFKTDGAGNGVGAMASASIGAVDVAMDTYNPLSGMADQLRHDLVESLSPYRLMDAAQDQARNNLGYDIWEVGGNDDEIKDLQAKYKSFSRVHLKHMAGRKDDKRTMDWHQDVVHCTVEIFNQRIKNIPIKLYANMEVQRVCMQTFIHYMGTTGDSQTVKRLSLKYPEWNYKDFNTIAREKGYFSNFYTIYDGFYSKMEI